MGATTTTGSGALPALTSIRFIAAMTVVLSHFAELGLLPMRRAFFDFVDGGRPAVSLFFVLSGFILTYTYREPLATGGPRAFYVARFARIYPVVLFGLALVAPVTAWLLHTGDAARLLEWFALKNAVQLSLMLSLPCQLLLLNAWFPFASINQPWNGPSDSVSCEAFFYALFPWLLRRLDGQGARRVVLACAAVWIAQGVGIVLIQSTLPASRSGFLVVGLPLLRMAEFVLGIGAALVFMSMRARRAGRHALGLTFVCVALAAIVVLAAWRPFAPVFFVEAPFFALLILGLALLERPVTGWLNSRALVKLGEASYSLYLIHVPLAYIALLAGFDRTNGWMVLAFAVWASVAVFRFYEEPMRRAIRARLNGASVPSFTPLQQARD
ncbi:acyltransferase family protein [Caballeronia ptereochthonis]|uniref:Acyltransferase n=1 Tax=Caballeronia ptereochthonis TaxID=1777144 RepID=A0A158D3W5_9BURK|nr:acyltransferase [Caballeronia ptereochthonis]SAK89325.1 acyltransferase [Caballeronia ptereochthonis]